MVASEWPVPATPPGLVHLFTMRATLAQSLDGGDGPLGRIATIEDVGAAAAFLASDLARNITGGVLHIDAGRYNMS